MSLNGLTRSDTDKNIIKYFGTIDDFLITSMSSQLGALTFINEGSTKRKEILAKFLDLEIFDKKFKTAKDDAADIKAAIKILETTDYDKELKEFRKELFNNEAATLKKKNSCECLKGDIEIAHKEIKELQDKIKSAPTDIIDIVNIRNCISQTKISFWIMKKKLLKKQKATKKTKTKFLRQTNLSRRLIVIP